MLLGIVGVLLVTIWQLHPNLLFSSSTTTGGDTGAHFIMPAFLRSSLLSHGQLTGWYPGWYDGFPLYTYYFVLPDLLAAVGSYVVPYGVAFKMATIAGSVAMPICAYVLGRLCRLRPPIPAVLAVVTLPFLFDPTFTIDGGNLFSTLAGEYAFSLSLAVSLVVIGLFVRGVRTAKGSVVTPIALAACLACHLIPFLFAVVAGGVVTVLAMLPPTFFRGDDAQGSAVGLLATQPLSRARALWWSARTLLIGLALAGWWLVPFATTQSLANSMGYINDTNYGPKLLPSADNWVFVLAGLGIVLGMVRQSRFVATFGLLAAGVAVAFVIDPQGSLWNERVIPLWFISVYILAGWFVGDACATVARAWRRWRVDRSARGDSTRRPPVPRWLPGAVGGPIAALVLALVVVVPPFIPQVIPASTLERIGITPGANQVSAWAAWNYSGYEAKPAYGEYRALITTMAKLGKTSGCGRAMWEYNPDLDRFGTPMALMLLPYWTNGCIDSQEGLFFESSATTPYHFLVQSEVSVDPSDPEVGLPYGSTDVSLGVAHLQLLGVKYLMLSSPQTQAQAAKNPSLTLVDTTGPWPNTTGGPTSTTWKIYEIRSSPVVTPLTHLPVVVPGIADTADTWRSANVSWFLDASRWDVPLASSGPTTWPRGTVTTTTSPSVPATTVADVSVSTSSVGFHVARLGTPVLVKVSYFPQWRVSGADGPYRVSPNLMVVVPTRHTVLLSYGQDTATILGLITSVVGVAALGVMVAVAWWRRQGSLRPRHAR